MYIYGNCTLNCAPVFINAQVTGNSSNSGADGIYSHGSTGSFTNVTVANNNIIGIFYDGGANNNTWQNSIIWDSISGTGYNTTHSLVKGSSGGFNGNLNAEGLIHTDIFNNPASGDYRPASGSPAINKGDNTFFSGLNSQTQDLSGNLRLLGGLIDIGAYEYQGPEALPVTFGSLEAMIKNGQLIVNWLTESETNTDHFLLQLSADGVHFKTVQTVQSKATDGNSNEVIEYSSNIPLTGLSVGAGFLLIAIIGCGRRRYGIAITAILLSLGLFACTKNDLFKSIEDGKLFVRIVQVDKDGKESVSKVVKVIE